ncbi:gamma-glutamyltransferase [Paeniroseomonas aquatica]|uniref:gamma-glutamyltransferase n=1 Tax=Paeniroseomonas aquatica TaxID=373043 RepID=UPI00361EBEC2
MAGWRAGTEAPLTHDYRGHTVLKCGPWSQGPAMLQALALLEGFDLAAMDPVGADYAHTVTEAMKLAFADREAFTATRTSPTCPWRRCSRPPTRKPAAP